MSARWEFEVPDGVFANHALSEAMYKHVAEADAMWARMVRVMMENQHAYKGHPGAYSETCRACHPPVTLRRRLASWWYLNRPRLHRGPCPDDD